MPPGDESCPERNDDLRRVLGMLASRGPQLNASAGQPADAVPRSTSYLPVPPVLRPRLLLPADTPIAGAAALRLRAGAQRRWHRRLAYHLGSAGMKTGLPQRVWPHRLEVEETVSGRISLTQHLATLLARPVVVAASVGPRDPHQSQMLIALDADGRPLAYVKVGWNQLNRRLVRNEARALRRLGEVRLSTMTVPSVLYAGAWQDLELLLTAPIQAKGQRAASRSRPPPLPVTLEVAATGARQRLHLSESPYWWDLQGRLNVAAIRLDRHTADALARAVARVGTVGATLLSFAGWHGDWVAWNLARDRERLLVWDWEYWSDAAPVGFDILHFFYGAQFFRGRGDVITAWDHATARSETLLRWLGVEGPALPLVHALYALEMLARRLEIQAQGGGVDDPRFFPQIYAVIDAAVSAL